jgi:hypothetical protein
VTFESGSRLERIEESAFQSSGLKSIVIPSSAVVLGKSSFRDCRSLESVTFESGSRLERIEESAFCGSGLKTIGIPSSVTFIDSSAVACLSNVCFLSTHVAKEAIKIGRRPLYRERRKGKEEGTEKVLVG